ncbi:MAG: glycosyltransferase [Pseudoflavonifractor sp.]|nr:glycosyltransferase [Alloprevotella sp.]MCM1116192.1 glycosyltransferase [Pseudoflavonifractor sp.]
MKVTFISHSDTLGGAAIVTYRLMRALRREGIDARMVVYTKRSDDPNVTAIGSRYIRGMKFLAERLQIALANGFSRDKLFKVSTASIGMRVYSHPWVKEADVVALGWFNQGLVSLRGLKKLHKLGKPLVWTMHDMWAMTGICHHAYECTGYRLDGCGNCQFLAGKSRADLSRRVWQKKMDLATRVPIQYVAVSNWLATNASRSLLLREAKVDVIPNAFPVDYFSPEGVADPSLDPLASLGANELRVVMCAARLDDTIKGLPYAIDALNHIFDNHPEIARRMSVIFVGEFHDPAALDSLRLHHISLGRVNDPSMLRRIYAYSQVVLSTSLYETLPGTLIEGQSMGCIPVTFDRGGQCDIVDHLTTGYIAEYKNPESVAEGIIWGVTQTDITRDMLHESVVARFSSGTVAQRYIRLFNELLGQSIAPTAASEQ